MKCEAINESWNATKLRDGWRKPVPPQTQLKLFSTVANNPVFLTNSYHFRKTFVLVPLKKVAVDTPIC